MTKIYWCLLDGYIDLLWLLKNHQFILLKPVYIYGHTHIKEENIIGDTIVLNPGTGHKKVKKVFQVPFRKEELWFLTPRQKKQNMFLCLNPII